MFHYKERPLLKFNKFLGSAGYYKSFYRNSSRIILPLITLTQENKQFISIQQEVGISQLLKQKKNSTRLLSQPSMRAQMTSLYTVMLSIRD